MVDFEHDEAYDVAKQIEGRWRVRAFHLLAELVHSKRITSEQGVIIFDEVSEALDVEGAAKLLFKGYCLAIGKDPEDPKLQAKLVEDLGLGEVRTSADNGSAAKPYDLG